MKNQRVN